MPIDLIYNYLIYLGLLMLCVLSLILAVKMLETGSIPEDEEYKKSDLQKTSH